MKPGIHPIFSILILVAVTITASCSQAPEDATTMLDQSPSQVDTGAASTRRDLPRSFSDLSSSPGGLCETLSGASLDMELKYLGTLRSGQTLLAFKSPVPFDEDEVQAVVAIGETEYEFNCRRSAQGENLLECTGPSMPPESQGRISLQVSSGEAAPFEFAELAPVLHNALLLPGGVGLEQAWLNVYQCIDDPTAPQCETLEPDIFPHAYQQEYDLFGDTTPGLILFYSVASVSTDPRDVHFYPLAFLDTLAEQLPENCLLDLRPLANACAPLAYAPLEVNEIVALEDVLVVLQRAWDLLGNVYHYVFELGDYRPSSGETHGPPLDPDNWTYDELQVEDFRQVAGWLDEVGIAECLDFMIQGRTCAESHGWDFRLGDPEPDCATEEVVEIVNACLADSDVSGFVDPVAVGDTEALLDAIVFLDGSGIYEPWDLFQFWAESPHVYELWYPCTPPESLDCLADWFRYQDAQEANAMLASTLPPECDPDFPDSLWCQGMPDEDPTTELAQTCAQEIGWTGSLVTQIDQDLLTQAVALGLPWVSDLGGFPACLELYAGATAEYARYAALPLQAPAVCTAREGSAGNLTLNAYFTMPSAAAAGDDDVCIVTPPPDGSPCWLWNAVLCKWECYN